MGGFRIPRSVRIRGKRWRVRVSKGLQRRERVIGLCTFDDRLIEIDADLSPLEMHRTLVHEILHAVLHPTHYVTASQQERMILRLEEPLRSLIATGALTKRAA